MVYYCQEFFLQRIKAEDNLQIIHCASKNGLGALQCSCYVRNLLMQISIFLQVQHQSKDAGFGRAARKHVQTNFSLLAFGTRLEEHILDLLGH